LAPPGGVAANPYAAAGGAGVAGGGGMAPGEKPPNYLVPSILVTLCCCLILGIVAIVYAAQVDSKWNAGDFAGAYQASDNAKKWCWIAFGLGLLANLLVFGVQILAVIGAAGNANGPPVNF